jgi:spore coat polysaccharide biosynthesis protein SpsF
MRRVIAVVQARTGSTRLPGKVLRDLGGRPVLAWVVGAARASEVCDEIVVATTSDPADDEVARCAAALGARCVRGPVDDVLARFASVLDALGVDDYDAIVRLTADCPLLDPSVIARCAAQFEPGRVDYVTTDHEHTVAHGLDVEVVSVPALRRAHEHAVGADRAHVTSYIASRPYEFRARTVELEPACADLRLTLDEPADAELLDALVDKLGERATDYRNVVAYLRARPDLVAVNAHVTMKPIAAG